LRLEPVRRLVVQGGVFALRVVVSFDEGKDLEMGIVLIHEAAVLEHLGFERAHEGLRPGIVVRIGACGHALLNARLAQQSPIGVAVALDAAVAVEDQVRRRAPRLQGVLEGISHQFGAHVVGQRPVQNFKRAQADDHRQIKPSFRSRYEGQFPGPNLI